MPVGSLVEQSCFGPLSKTLLHECVEGGEVGRHQSSLFVGKGLHDVNVKHALIYAEQFIAGQRCLPCLILIFSDRATPSHLRIVNRLVGALEMREPQPLSLSPPRRVFCAFSVPSRSGFVPLRLNLLRPKKPSLVCIFKGLGRN